MDVDEPCGGEGRGRGEERAPVQDQLSDGGLRIDGPAVSIGIDDDDEDDGMDGLHPYLWNPDARKKCKGGVG